jgi:hypothetical protein
LDYALGYKKNSLFFFDYIKNLYFGKNINYENFKEVKKFIPTASKLKKKEYIINQSINYFKQLTNNLYLNKKFNLSEIYNFTLYSISVVNNGICIH